MGAKLLCEWWLLSCIPFCSLHCFWFSKNAKLALSPDQWLLCCNNPCTCTYFIPVVECLSWRIDDIRRMGAPAYHASALFFFWSVLLVRALCLYIIQKLLMLQSRWGPSRSWGAVCMQLCRSASLLQKKTQ